MSSRDAQRTLARSFEFEGLGIHSGVPCRATVCPAEAGRGIRFLRTDVPDAPELTVADIAEPGLPGRTIIGSGSACVQTIEHILAGLWTMEVDNALVEVAGPEIPAVDGSALPFAEAVAEAGLVELAAPRDCAVVKKEIAISEGGPGGASIAAAPSDVGGLSITYTLHYEGSPLAQGTASFEITPETFLAEIAPARTFCMAHEVEALRSAGLGKGATGENTLIIDGGNVIGNRLRMPSEPVRHKILDMLGDMALVGTRLRARIEGNRSGHALNRRMAARIRSAEPGEVELAAHEVGAPPR